MRIWTRRSAEALLQVLKGPPRLRYPEPSITAPFRRAQQYRQFHASPASRAISADYGVFERIARPVHSIEGWVSALEQVLPAHLQARDKSPPEVTFQKLDAAQILLAAQHPEDGSQRGVDLLYHLGVVESRWSVVIWLVQELSEEFQNRNSRMSRLTNVTQRWSQSGNLDELTDRPINLSPTQQPEDIETLSLSKLTYGAPQHLSTLDRLRHTALGQVWRSLGAMTQDCAGGDIQPEILEIIALLHHKEIMPTSIYHYEPQIDKLAVQAPPLLSLLSSRILTSLSDAAWRAHEKLVVEEAKAKGGEYAALRPEIPGSVYRVRVAGLRPELWMELILWSCLRGNWIAEGAEILHRICSDRAWKPVSWREHELDLQKSAPGGASSWTEWEYQFKTRAPDTMDAPTLTADFQSARTISSEVVSAFADALAGSGNIGVGERGLPLRWIIDHLRRMQQFLERSKLVIATGSWDGLLVRLFDHHLLEPKYDSTVIQDIVSLSPSISRRLPSTVKSMKANVLPDFVLDANMAMQGLLHRALQGQIGSGHFEAALQVLNVIITRADNDKRDSLLSFLRRRKSVMDTAARKGLFTSNFVGIDYPGFNTQIPPGALARLLDMATDAGAYEFAKWLVEGHDLDGPLITRNMYNDQNMQPALLGYAAETKQSNLVQSLVQQSTVADLRKLLDSQINALQWKPVVRLLEHLHSAQNRMWTMSNLTNLARVMLLLEGEVRAGSKPAEQNLDDAKRLFTDMVTGKYNGSVPLTNSRTVKIQTVLCVLSTISAEWGQFCESIQKSPKSLVFNMDNYSFNSVLDGVAATYGSAAARHCLITFWRPELSTAANNPSIFGTRQSAQMQELRPRPASQDIRQIRYIVKIPGTPQEVYVYTCVVPNTRSVLIILQKALEELDQQANAAKSMQPTGLNISYGSLSSEDDNSRDSHDPPSQHAPRSGSSSSQTVVLWAIRRLAELPSIESEFVALLDKALADHQMEEARSELRNVMLQVERRSSAEWSEIEFDESSSHASSMPSPHIESRDTVLEAPIPRYGSKGYKRKQRASGASGASGATSRDQDRPLIRFHGVGPA